MSNRTCVPVLSFCALILIVSCWSATAQLLPPDAVDLSKVKIAEKQTAADLCPVTLTAPIPSVADFEYQGVGYRFSSESARNQFVKAPQTFTEAARFARWENNFVRAMSEVWCPVPDQVVVYGPYWDVAAAEKFPKGEYFVFDVQTRFTDGVQLGIWSAPFM